MPNKINSTSLGAHQDNNGWYIVGNCCIAYSDTRWKLQRNSNGFVFNGVILVIHGDASPMLSTLSRLEDFIGNISCHPPYTPDTWGFYWGCPLQNLDAPGIWGCSRTKKTYFSFFIANWGSHHSHLAFFLYIIHPSPNFCCFSPSISLRRIPFSEKWKNWWSISLLYFFGRKS